MSRHFPGHRRVLLRDLAIFLLKLVLDGVKGAVVLQFSVGAALPLAVIAFGGRVRAER